MAEQGSVVANWLWKTVSPVFLLMGTFGNVLSIIVLTRTGTRKSSTALYLTALALSDLIVLYTGLLRWWIVHLFGTDVRHLGNFGCKLHWFFIFASTEHSSWLLVAVTCERIISTMWPHRVKLLCTKKSATFTIFTITLAIYGGSSHLLYGMGLQTVYSSAIENDSKNGTTTWTPAEQNRTNAPINKIGGTPAEPKLVCSTIDDVVYTKFFNFVYPWMDLFLYFFIPAVILSIGEVLIIQKIVSSRRLHMRMMSANAGDTKRLSDKSTSVTVMLLTVNGVFILCTTPISIYLIGMPYWVDPNVGFTHTQEIAWVTVNLLMYLNHSINFILYFLSGSRFRKKVLGLFKRKRNYREPESSLSQRETIFEEGTPPHDATRSSMKGNYKKKHNIEALARLSVQQSGKRSKSMAMHLEAETKYCKASKLLGISPDDIAINMDNNVFNDSVATRRPEAKHTRDKNESLPEVKMTSANEIYVNKGFDNEVPEITHM